MHFYQDLSQFVAKVSLETPLEDYTKQMSEYVVVDFVVDDEILQDNYQKLSTAAEKAIWKLLFDSEQASQANQDKALELLKIHKQDASFHHPWSYNDWVVSLRDELLKRKMLDFWKKGKKGQE